MLLGSTIKKLIGDNIQAFSSLLDGTSIPKLVFTGSAIVIVGVALLSSFGENPKKGDDADDKKEKKQQKKSTKKPKKFKKREVGRHFLTEEEPAQSDSSTTYTPHEVTGNHGKHRQFASDYEGDLRFNKSNLKRSHLANEEEELYFMIFDKLNS